MLDRKEIDALFAGARAILETRAARDDRQRGSTYQHVIDALRSRVKATAAN
jgi:hypothetical protein